MSRPTSMKVDGTVYWTLMTYDEDGILVDADSTPSVAVRKNGSSVGDAVTVTKRAATTGIYDCEHSPSGEVEGDTFIYEESVTISSQAYLNPWSLEVKAAERGTDDALLDADKPTDFSLLAINGSGEVTTSNPASGGGSAHTAADVANLILVTPANKLATDASGNVEANNMRGTDGANTVAPVDVSSDVSAILADTNELQGNQGDWATATTVVASNMRGTDNASTFDHTSDAVVTDTASRDASKADVSGLSTFDPSTDTVVTDAASRAASKADVSGLSTFDSSTDQVVASNMRGTDNALLASSAPANWSTLVVGTGADAGKVTTSNPASGSGSSHTAQDVANLILVTPANKLATDASGDVSANNMRGTDGANTVAPVDVSSDVALILADTNELQGNQSDWATATGFSTPADVTAAQGVITTAISGLNDFDPANDVVAHVTLVDTTTDLTNSASGGTNPADIYNYFTDGTREDAFKADTSNLSTFDPASDTVARVTLVDTTTDLTNQSAGGVGMFQASVRVQDSSGAALQGARINVDGTTLSLTTGVNGEVVFNLDSGVYLLNLLPPANYDTPSGQVLTITASDPAQTVFSLTSTSPPDGCDVPWIG